jgi:hypothetical protein
MATVIVTGSVCLVLLAILVGRIVDQESRRRSWREIAAERRWVWEQRQSIPARVAVSRCPGCPYRYKQISEDQS